MLRKIHQRMYLNLLLICCILSLIYFGYIYYQQTKSLISANRMVTHTYQVIEMIQRILYKLNLATSKQRGYLLTNDLEYKTVYVEVLRAIDLDIYLLKENTQDNPRQRENIKEFVDSLDARLQFITSLTTTFEKEGLPAAIKKLDDNNEIYSFNHTLDIAAQMVNEEKRLLTERNMEVVKATNQTMSMAIAGEVIALTIILICLIVLNYQMTIRARAENKLFQLAYFNPLTHLPNRASLLNKLAEEIREAESKNYYISVIFLNLDNFKNINDSFGFETGDRILKLIAMRLKNYIKNACFLAHLGGNDFVVLVKNTFDIVPVVKEILALIEQPIQIEDQKIKLSGSIGVSVFPTDGTDVNHLLKNANMAMYVAKENGKNTYQFVTPEMTMQVEKRALLGYYLQQALVMNELTVFYQPKISLKNGQPIGVEALMRWRRPNGTYVDPHDFIALAEDSSLILVLGEWILTTVCKQIKKWEMMGVPIHNVAVNVSPSQVNRKNFADKVRGILKETNVDPQKLELEITESILLTDVDANVDTLSALKKTGVQITIDDFGTGFSTFGYFRSFAVDKIKIDQSFVKLVTPENNDSVIIRAIITMAHDLGFTVVAEGVETPFQVEFLKRSHCDEAQGFYYSKAVSVTEVEQFFKKGHVAT